MAQMTLLDEAVPLVDAAAGLMEEAPDSAMGEPGGGAPLDAGFIRRLYRFVPAEDLQGRSPETLVAAARSLHELMAERRPGRVKLRLLMGAEAAGLTGNGYENRVVIQIVNDDMPFLLDSTTAALTALNLPVHLVIHPILAVRRDGTGRLLGIESNGAEHEALRESVMHIEISGPVDKVLAERIRHDLEHVLGDVRRAVLDWKPTLVKVEAIAEAFNREPPPVPLGEIMEVVEFLNWLAEDNFTFLGYREYRLTEQGMQVIPSRGKGLLRDDDYLVFDGIRNVRHLPADLQDYLNSPLLMMITKSNRRSTVHRAVPLDSIGIKAFDQNGAVVGMRLIVGLFTSASYNQLPDSVPVLRRKVLDTMARSGLDPKSHDGKALRHILDSLPRDELFQSSDADLQATAFGVLRLQNRRRVALFTRRDTFERFVSCLVYLPTDAYSSEIHARVLAILEEAFNGVGETMSTLIEETPLARLHIIVKTVPGEIPDIAVAEIEQRLAAAALVWADTLYSGLLAAVGETRAHMLAQRYRRAFPTEYREHTDGATAVADIEGIERVGAGEAVALRLVDNGAGDLRLKTFHRGAPMALSTILPMLENMGFRVLNETPFEVKPHLWTRPVWIQEFQLEPTEAVTADVAGFRAHFEAAFPLIWAGAIENDGFNRLIVTAGLSAEEAVILRAYAKFMRQAGTTFSQNYIEDALVAYPAITANFVVLFHTLFDPARTEPDRAAAAQRIEAEIATALNQVASLDEDRILRGFLALIGKSLRTNFYQRDADGAAKRYLSIKLASRELEMLPRPRPLCEIFVYSPRMEGVHLRGGKVARGGIRWSDRREDFRTEVLGLMKAQQVKNAVIVPMGSKGGFVVKQPPKPTGTATDREALAAEVVACYRMLIQGMLDLTDSIEGEQVKVPDRVLRRDGDDPYLVVAADKGTATFSDIANGISADYGFWLGDAFASGGSIGYDHKAMAITARGAWEAVKRHFREIGTDIQTQDFTCIGVGDMSGDVFGNGMLLSKHTRLLAAFDHRHIFIDPNPDAAASWEERQRLFKLPRSSWADYAPELISQGGGVYPRTLKAIVLSAEARALFGIKEEALAPMELIRVLLRHNVDLLFFGGIGTYVKASSEPQSAAGDRANDGVRVDASELRAKIIGEGANLAMTQRGRIEYALAGGRLNTDAIDNSAGVDTSDHEVNIKIGLSNMMLSGALDPATRPSFLAAMTDEVAGLVLADNYLQTLALSLAEAEAAQRIDDHARLIRALERGGKLDRALEFLPDEETLARRHLDRRGLTRPELAVLLAYAKNDLVAELVTTDLADDAVFDEELMDYFPRSMMALSRAGLEAHRLRREIIVTTVANEIVNRLGPSFVTEMAEKTGRSLADIVRAWRITRDVFDLRELWTAIEALDARVPAAVQTKLLLAVQHLAEAAARWFMQSGLNLDIAALIARFEPGVRELSAGLAGLLPPGAGLAFGQLRTELAEAGIADSLAARVAGLRPLGAAMDILRLSESAGLPPVECGALYFAIGERLGIDTLKAAGENLAAASHWQRLAASAQIDDLAAIQHNLVKRILTETASSNADARIQEWLAPRGPYLATLAESIAEISHARPPELAMLLVATRQLRTLALV